MNETPLVSIILSSYNGERGIGKTLTSLEQQTYSNIEMVVVDDGSTDRTAEIIRKHMAHDPRIRLVQHKTNLRLAAGRNTGIKNSQGEIVCFTDDDCIADPRWIEELVKVYRVRPEVGGVGGRIEPYHAHSLLEKYASYGKNRVYDHTPVVGFSGRFTRYLQKYFGWNSYTLKNGQPIESIMGMNSSYRRTTLERIQGFDTTLVKGEDWDANIRARRTNPAAKNYFDPKLSRGVDWELNVRLQKQNRPLFVYCDSAVIYHTHRQGFGAFVYHLFSYGKAYTEVARRHPKILLLPYPIPIFFMVALILAVFNHPIYLVIVLAFIYLKDAPYVLSQLVRRKDWSFFLFPVLDLIRETSYNTGIFFQLVRR